MADDADRTQERLEREAGACGGASAEYCKGCGEAIPPARRAASPGCTHCVDCLHEIEVKERGRGYK